MGGVVVLHPQNFLNDRSPLDNLIPSPMKSNRRPKSPQNPKPARRSPKSSPNPNPNSTRSNGRKRSPTGLRRNSNSGGGGIPTVVTDRPAKDLVMGQVKILKRVEALNETVTVSKDRNLKADVTTEKKYSKKDLKTGKERTDDFVLSSTERLGPEPEMVPKQMKNLADFFAGSAFVDSPPPSSLPLPGFFAKKFASKEEDPSADLRRLLRLNLP